MATPKPGEIRCPTCHRSTPPATFCQQCGSRIPADALARPRGMDRDELQERIRARREGGDPWRRGAPSAGESGAHGGERFEQQPEDATARRGSGSPAEPRVDHYTDARHALGLSQQPDFTREPDPGAYDGWSSPRVQPSAAQPWTEAEPGQPSYPGAYRDTYGDAGGGTGADAGDDYGYGAEGYAYDYPYEEERRRRGGGAGLAILGVLALGVLALMGGAVLAGVLGGDGAANASPTPSETAAPSLGPTPQPTPTAAVTAASSATPAPSGAPIVFPDGFVAQAQPCLPGTANVNGCNSNGTSNSGTVDIWVGFQKGTAEDVVGATLVGPDGTVVAEGFIDLARIGCARTCNGWTRFNFSGLDPGNYEVRISRNGDPAAIATFEVA